MPKTGCFLANTGFVIKRQSVPGSLKLLGSIQPRQIFSTAPPVDTDQWERCFTPRVHIQDTLFMSIFYLEGCPRLITEDMTHNVAALKSVVLWFQKDHVDCFNAIHCFQFMVFKEKKSCSQGLNTSKHVWILSSTVWMCLRSNMIQHEISLTDFRAYNKLKRLFRFICSKEMCVLWSHQCPIIHSALVHEWKHNSLWLCVQQYLNTPYMWYKYWSTNLYLIWVFSFNAVFYSTTIQSEIFISLHSSNNFN